MVAVPTLKSADQSNAIARLQALLVEINAAAKAVDSHEDRRLMYRLKDQLLNNIIETRAASTGAIRVSGQHDYGRATLVVSIESRGRTRNFHMPVDCLTPAARAAAADVLGGVAANFGVRRS